MLPRPHGKVNIPSLSVMGPEGREQRQVLRTVQTTLFWRGMEALQVTPYHSQEGSGHHVLRTAVAVGLARGNSDLLVVIIFHKLLELLNVAHRLQVLLHVWQGREVICGSANKTQWLDSPAQGMLTQTHGAS